MSLVPDLGAFHTQAEPPPLFEPYNVRTVVTVQIVIYRRDTVVDSETMAATGKMVKITYASRAPGVAITKNLFGYKGWKTRRGPKTSAHKPMVGALEGIPLQRVGRATIVL